MYLYIYIYIYINSNLFYNNILSTDIYNVEKITGEYMSSLILNCLNEHNLPIENLREELYDGGI